MKKFMEEFKAFAMRGNVIDMAVGVIIGGAFKAIADSLVNDIINPALGVFTGGHTDLSGLSFSLPGGGELMLGNCHFELPHHGLCGVLHHQSHQQYAR